MKPIEVENVGVVNIFGKSFLGQQKIGKTPFSAINAIFTYFVFPIFLCMTLIGVLTLCGCCHSEKEWKSPKMANVNKNRSRHKN